MNVIILTPRHVAELGAGDFQQAVQTTNALNTLGHSAVHCVKSGSAKSQKVGLEELTLDILKAADVVHFIPGSPDIIPDPLLDEAGFDGAVACSSVYWDSWKHRKVARGMGSSPWMSLFRYSLKLVRSRVVGRPSAYSFADLVLPNSNAEADVLRRFYRLPSSASIRVVPNGVPDALFANVEAWRQSFDGVSDIMLFPGVFAPRKNQLGFIRALRHQPELPVVFMGGALDNEQGRLYYEQCKAEAPSTWVFTGRVPYLSEEFRSWMLRARIACLTSSCETPGLALLEAAVFGARPVITREGGTSEYYRDVAEYVDSTSASSIRSGVMKAWSRGSLSESERAQFDDFRWSRVAAKTVDAYRSVK